jgi:hypothetical protein
MFVHVATLYSVHPEVADNFIHFVRVGHWHRLARLAAPDLIAYDLLQHQSAPTPLFLCIDFWASREKYLRARESGVYDHLLNMRSRLAAATIDLGAFMFPSPAEPDTGIPQIADLYAETEARGSR